MSRDSTPEFFNVQPVQAALDLLFAQWSPQPRHESLDPRAALGRVLAASPRSPLDLPEFRRSTVDGYAVRAADTFGASQNLPAYLKVVGSVMMGKAANFRLSHGATAEISTGGMLPDEADAVVMIERTQSIRPGEIEVLAPAAPGENVVQIGEDARKGEALLPTGHRLRLQDIGGLLAAGILTIEVAVKPRVSILSSGDELVPPEESPASGQIRDINAYTLAALITECGGEPVLLGLARDDLEDYRAHANAGFAQVDMLVLTAGSSVSTRDLTRAVINSLGQPGILQHGLAVKPGKPTIIALCDGKPVIGLPGNPVSALLVARQILIPIIRRALGETARRTAAIRATLASNVPSTSGREDTIPVKLIERDGVLMAESIFGKSNLIYTLVNADGLMVIPLNSGGLKAGTIVEVIPFD
jgi:molybdopterin molybdotransferase